jgi:hypothetical protein
MKHFGLFFLPLEDNCGKGTFTVFGITVAPGFDFSIDENRARNAWTF